VTQVVVVLLWPAKAGRVIHAPQCSKRNGAACPLSTAALDLDREISFLRNLLFANNGFSFLHDDRL